jgi:hypothetical protein
LAGAGPHRFSSPKFLDLQQCKVDGDHAELIRDFEDIAVLLDRELGRRDSPVILAGFHSSKQKKRVSISRTTAFWLPQTLRSPSAMIAP